MIQGHYQEGLPWLQESLGIFESAGARLSIAMAWSELAVCHLGLGDDEKTMELFRKAERVNYEAGVIHNYQVVLANIGNVYLHRRDYFNGDLVLPASPSPGARNQGSGFDQEVDTR